MDFGKSLILFPVFLLIAGCATFAGSHETPSNYASNKFVPKATDGRTDRTADDEDVAEAQDEEAASEDSEMGSEEENLVADRASLKADEDEIAETIAHMPLEINDNVKRWIEYFSVKDRDRFQKWLIRGQVYKPMITNVLKENGLPEDLYYLAMIESGFNTHAASHASAVGTWQFIRATGKRYGLSVNSEVDERRDPMRATKAAVRYLSDLHNVFQSWYLAMAAYNAGEMRIMTAIMSGNSRDFWELVRNRKLPRETMEYIPKFLAAVIIGHNPEHYGFDDPSNDNTLPELELVEVPSPISFKSVSQVTKVPYEELVLYNPHLRRKVTPASERTYEIWIPTKYRNDVLAAKDDLKRHQGRYVPASESSSRQRVAYHRVRRGENLYLIAKKYNLTISQLKRINGLRSNVVYSGQKLKVAGDAVAYTKYRVKRGDNLHKISKKFNTSIHQIKRINNLSRNTIYVGQVLKVGRAG
jgi:membrane-bound lytic murein transglycosylase D